MLIVTGVGYLGQRKVTGYFVGCGYGASAVINNIIHTYIFKVGMFGVIFLVYPVLTLVLLNTTFKKCFVN